MVKTYELPHDGKPRTYLVLRIVNVFLSIGIMQISLPLEVWNCSLCFRLLRFFVVALTWLIQLVVAKLGFRPPFFFKAPQPGYAMV